MNSALNKVLHEIEIDISRAHDAASQRLVEALRAQLAQHRLHNHKLTVEWAHDYAYLGVDGEEWQLTGMRNTRRPVVVLLDDIDDILGKCDDGVIRSITGTIL